MFVIFLTVLPYLMSMAACQASVEVPMAVKTAFTKKYPKALKVSWELEDDGEYEAEFKMEGKEMSANFKSDGSWIETETEIKKGDLPQAIKATLASQYSGYQVEEVAQVQSPDEPLTFEVELEKKSDDSNIEILFRIDGSVAKKEIKKENDDEGH